MQQDQALEKEFQDDIAVVLGTENLQKFAGKRLLLTGGSGFLGTLFKQFFLYCNKAGLINPPLKIVSVDNYLKNNWVLNDETQDKNLTTITHDLILKIDDKLGNEDIHFILNCAGCASPFFYLKYPFETSKISTIGTDNLLGLAENKKSKILNFSSSEVLGTPKDEDVPTDEEVTPCVKTMDSRSPYDVTKMYIEMTSWTYKTQKNLDCKVVRPFNIIGRISKNDYRVIPNYLSKLIKNEQISVYKPGTQTRTFCYYTDFIVGTLLVLLNGKDLLYHIGNSDNEIGMYDLAVKLQAIAGKKDLVSLVDAPEVYKHEPLRRCPSIEKARKELGYSPKIQIDEMLGRLYTWASENYK